MCLDIDDTLSTHGKLTAEAYSALWKLKAAGLVVVPVTGRPAGWCDHIARFWPVDAVVGENGAFVFYMDGGVRKRLDTPSEPDPKVAKKKLMELAASIQKEFPGAKWASDQAYREADLAIDVCEDVPAWSEAETRRLLDLCRAKGATAKLSSVHVNTWFGTFDKRRGLENWMTAGAPGVSGQAPLWQDWIYVGDSPNDEPSFEFFQRSVGVANLRPYLPQLKFPPRWITPSEAGKGFQEMAERLIVVMR